MVRKRSRRFGKGGIEVKKGTLPKYREINAKIRVTGENMSDYQTLNHPIGLIYPIFQIEGWIEEYEKSSSSAEIILTSPASETFKKVHRDVFGKEAPMEDIPYIIPISELKKVLNGLKIKISKFVNSVK